METSTEVIIPKSLIYGSEAKGNFAINRLSIRNHQIRGYDPTAFRFDQLFFIPKDGHIKEISDVVLINENGKPYVSDFAAYNFEGRPEIASMMMEVVDKSTGRRRVVYVPSLHSENREESVRTYSITGRQLMPLLVHNLSRALASGNKKAISRLQEKVNHLVNLNQ